MKTLQDYILDAQAKEARFLKAPIDKTQKQWDNYVASRNAVTVASQVANVLQPNYVTEEGIPCHNRATALYYKLNK